MSDLQTIKEKIAKLLRLQQSSNANEAANAACFVEKLCREHGLTPADCFSDPDSDQTVDFFLGKARKRWDPSHRVLIGAVVDFFNGRTVGKACPGGRILHIFASESAQVQIEIYCDYLLEQMNAAADACGGDRAFKNNFRKGYALEVEKRLEELKSKQEKEGVPDASASALVVSSRNATQFKAATAARDAVYPRLRSGSSYRVGHGAAAGRQAGGAVGLSLQVGSSRGVRALPAG